MCSREIASRWRAKHPIREKALRDIRDSKMTPEQIKERQVYHHNYHKNVTIPKREREEAYLSGNDENNTSMGK